MIYLVQFWLYCNNVFNLQPLQTLWINFQGRIAAQKSLSEITKVIMNLDDLTKSLPETAEPLIQCLRSTLKLHTMCVEEDFQRKFIKRFYMNLKKILNPSMIFWNEYDTKNPCFNSQLRRFFSIWKKINMKNTYGEHHEALHHTLKDFERTKGFFMRKT